MKKTRKPATLVLSMLLLLSMLLSACGGPAAPGPSQPVDDSTPGSQAPMDTTTAVGGDFVRKTGEGTFTIAYDEEPATLEPTQIKLIAGWTISNMVFDNIIAMDPETGEIYGVLAESFEYTDPYTLEIKMKDNICFSNGTKATSDDMLFTLERLSVSSRFASNYACIDFDNTTCPDDLTLVIKFKELYAPFLSYLAHPAAALESRAYFEEVGEDGYSRNPIGTGAYTVESWDAGERVTLKRNDNYWGEKGTCETIIIRFILESTTRMIEYETGGVDAIYNLSGTDIDRMAAGEISNSVLYTKQGENISVLEMYKGFEPLQNKDVRLALAHAVDWEALVDTVYGSSAVLADSIVPPDCLYYKSTGVYDYDPGLSRELLAGAGYGEPGSLQLKTYVYAGTEEEVCEIIQAFLKDVGVTMDIEIVDIPTMIGAQVSGECTFGLSNSTTTSRDPDQAISSSRQTSDYGIAVINGFDDLQALYDAGAVEEDPEARREIYEQIQQYYFDECVRIPVRVMIVSYAVRDYVEGFQPTSSGILTLAGVNS
ncbi:MAG: ABC transporter substrate-binding protein [Oscillospiraceae bacterium]|nr:ABC transporter substrate-binding protein [Oscillospiraceae bacterium]